MTLQVALVSCGTVVVVEGVVVVVTSVDVVGFCMAVILKFACHFPGKFENIPKLFESLLNSTISCEDLTIAESGNP